MGVCVLHAVAFPRIVGELVMPAVALHGGQLPWPLDEAEHRT